MNHVAFPLASRVDVQLQQYDRLNCFYAVPSTEHIEIHAPMFSLFYLTQYPDGDWAFCFRPDWRLFPRLPGWRVAPVINEVRIRVPQTAFDREFAVYRGHLAVDLLDRLIRSDQLRRGIYSQREGERRPRNVVPIGGFTEAGARAFADQYWPGNETALDDAFTWAPIPVRRRFFIGWGMALDGPRTEVAVEIVHTTFPHLRYESTPRVAEPNQVYYFDVDQYFRELSLNGFLLRAKPGANHPYLRDRLRQRGDIATWTSTIEPAISGYPYHAVLRIVGREASEATAPGIELAGGLQGILLRVSLLDALEIEERVLTLGRRVFDPPALVADRFHTDAVLYGALVPSQRGRWQIKARGASPTVEVENWGPYASFPWQQIAALPETGRKTIIITTLEATSELTSRRLGFGFHREPGAQVRDALDRIDRALAQYTQALGRTIVLEHGRAPDRMTHGLAAFLSLYALVRQYRRVPGSLSEDEIQSAMRSDGPYQILHNIHNVKSSNISRHLNGTILQNVHILIDQGFRTADKETIIALGAVIVHLRRYAEGRATLGSIFGNFYDQDARSTGDRPKIVLREFVGAWQKWVTLESAPGGPHDAEVQEALLEILETWAHRDVIGRLQEIAAPEGRVPVEIAEIGRRFEIFSRQLNEGPLGQLGLELRGSPRLMGGALQIVEQSTFSWNAAVASFGRAKWQIWGETLDFFLDAWQLKTDPNLTNAALVAMGAYSLSETIASLPSRSARSNYYRAYNLPNSLSFGRVPAALAFGIAEGAIITVRAVTARSDYLERGDDDAASWSAVVALGAAATTIGVALGAGPLLMLGLAFVIIGGIGEAMAADPEVVTALRHTALGASYARVVEERDHRFHFLHEDYRRFQDFRLHELYFLSQFRRVEVEARTPSGGISVEVRPSFVVAPRSTIRLEFRRRSAGVWRWVETIEINSDTGGELTIGGRVYLITSFSVEGRPSFRIVSTLIGPRLPAVDQVLVFVSWRPLDGLDARHLDSNDSLAWWRSPDLCSMGMWVN